MSCSEHQAEFLNNHPVSWQIKQMLIISKTLLEGNHEHVSWQLKEGKSRTSEHYILVTEEQTLTVARRVFKTALALDLDMSMSDILQILRDWMVVSPEEKKAWFAKGSSNDPIFSPKAWVERGQQKRRAEVRIYDNTVDLVLAIMGRLRARKNEQLEVLLGQLVLESTKIRVLTGRACEKVIRYIKSLQASSSKLDDLDKVIQQEYRTLHKLTWSAWATRYPFLPTKINIMALHDVYTWLDEHHQWHDPWNDDGNAPLFKNKHTMRHNVGTVNEDSPWTVRARQFDLPTWAGPSGTTHGLGWMLHWLAQVGPDELLVPAAGSSFLVWME